MNADPQSCPWCGAGPLDTHTQAPLGDARPEPGDVTVCLYCARLLVFSEGLQLRRPTAAEHAEAMARADVRRAVSVVKTHGPRDPGRVRLGGRP